MKIDSIDHVVFTVKDINASCEFYSKVLGMEVRYVWRRQESSGLRLTEDQSPTTWAREHSDSGKANPRIG